MYIGYAMICITSSVVILVVFLLVGGNNLGGWVGVENDKVNTVDIYRGR